MDGRFPVRVTTTIHWPDLHGAIIERYLPPDHGIRLKLVFVRTVQHTTLLKYVERFQVLDSALIFAELVISDMDKVFQFIQGLQKNEDRRFVLEQNPENLTQQGQGRFGLRAVGKLRPRVQGVGLGSATAPPKSEEEGPPLGTELPMLHLTTLSRNDVNYDNYAPLIEVVATLLLPSGKTRALR
eukprot:333569-Rhodomonas_salina.1